MSKSAYQAYGASSKLGLTGCALEAEAFTQAARKLQKAKDNDQNRSLAMAALRYNNRLWTVVQSAITESGTELPEAVMAELLSLSLYVDKRTREAIADPKPELLDVLIDINRDIALAQYSK